MKKNKIIIMLITILLLTIPNLVKAETYNVTPKNATFNLWTSTGAYSPTQSIDELHENNSATNFFAFTESIELEGLLANGNPNVLFPGQYLIEFYVYSTNSTISPTSNCQQYKSNFTNVNMTTGNWVSNEIASQCVDVYNTTYNGVPAVRMLYKFTYKGASVGADGITELKFYINSSPTDWFYSGTTGFHYGMSSSNIYSYDSAIISEFNKFKQNQTIISQNGVIISALDGVIQRQNEAHQDSVNTQNAINGITNADYNGNTEQPNTSDYDDYENAEENLLDNMENMDLNEVTIAIDTNSSNFVWNTMTSLIQSNAIIFSMIISILSIGIIKLMLGR